MEPVVGLDLGVSTSRVRVEGGARSDALTLPIGTSTVLALFRSDPPRAVELEAAIDVVEEAVMPLVKLLPGRAVLVTQDALLQEVITMSTGAAGSRFATLDAVEAQFALLALAAQRAGWTGESRMSPMLAAGLLILREFMHHAGFDRIELFASAKAGRSA